MNGCPMCLRDEESVEHLLLNCKSAQTIWMAIIGGFDCCWALPHSLPELFQAWKTPIGDPRGKVMWRLSFLLVIWTIWKERNMRCFEGIACNESRLVEKLKFLGAFWVSILPYFRGYSLDQIASHWKEVAFSMTGP